MSSYANTHFQAIALITTGTTIHLKIMFKLVMFLIVLVSASLIRAFISHSIFLMTSVLCFVMSQRFRSESTVMRNSLLKLFSHSFGDDAVVKFSLFFSLNQFGMGGPNSQVAV